MTFYIKNEDGSFSEADNEVNKLIEQKFSEKSDAIIKSRLERLRDSETRKVREELEPKLREEVEKSMREKLHEEFEAEYKPKLDEANNKISELTTSINRKTIASEFGLSEKLEEFLGNGDMDSMREKAETLKDNMSMQGQSRPLEKETSSKSRVFEETGLNVQI